MKGVNLLALIGCVALLLFPALAGPGNVFGQGILLPLRLEDVEGTRQDLSTVLVTGRVVNPLPWYAVDVEITVLFEEDPTEPLATQVIERIPAWESADFSIKKVSGYNLRTFRTGITDYALQSDEVVRLLDLYHETDDSVLKIAIARAFSQMSARAVPALLEAIAITDRPAHISAEQMHTDLMCLEALTVVSDPRAVWPVLQLLAWYEQHDEMDLAPIKSEILLDSQHPLNKLSILEDFDYLDDSLVDLTDTFLVRIGSAGIPYLLRAQNSHSRLVRELAQAKLAELDKVTITGLLHESDPAVLADIIVALGEVKRGEAVIPLLELAHANAALLDTVDRSILAMEGTGAPGLVSTLAHPNGKVADHAERLLRLQADKIVPELEQALRDQKQPIPADVNTPEALVDVLRERADVHINAEIEMAFEDVRALFQAKDCERAAEAIKAIETQFASRDTTARYAIQVSQVYQCEARALAETGEYASAIAVALKVEQLNPDDAALQADLVHWFIEQGKLDYEAKQWDKAVAQFRSVLQREPDNLFIRRWFGRLVLRANLFYLSIGVLGLVMIVFISSHLGSVQK